VKELLNHQEPLGVFNLKASLAIMFQAVAIGQIAPKPGILAEIKQAVLLTQRVMETFL